MKREALYWRGKPVADMSREELLNVVYEMAEKIAQQHSLSVDTNRRLLAALTTRR